MSRRPVVSTSTLTIEYVPFGKRFTIRSVDSDLSDILISIFVHDWMPLVGIFESTQMKKKNV